jgi:hypothetical protein
MKKTRTSRLITTTLAAAGVLVGILGVGIPAAQASPGSNYYVALTGADTNTCLIAAHPCKTIARAVAQATTRGGGGTIHVAKGAYTGQVTIASPSLDNLAIKGAGETQTKIQPPATPTKTDVDSDSTSPETYDVDVHGVTGFTLEDLTVNGTHAINSFTSCTQDPIGVYFHDASGTMSSVAVTGIDMAPSAFGCQGGLGIYVTSDTIGDGAGAVAAGTSTVTMSHVSELSPGVTAKTTTALPKGSATPELVGVSTIPATFHSGQIEIAGTTYSAVVVGRNTLRVTYGSSQPVPYRDYTDSAVRYNPFTPAYNKNGITCDDPNTTCHIVDSTVQGDGPTDLIGQNGVQIWAAVSTITGSSITGNSYTGGPVGAGGIIVFNPGALTVTGNTIASNDLNFYALGNYTGFPLFPNAIGAWTIANNKLNTGTALGLAHGAFELGEGLILDSGCAGANCDIANPATATSINVAHNTLTGNTGGGIMLLGTVGATIGGSTTALGNTVSGGQLGIYVGGPGSDFASSTNNNIFNNKVTGSEIGAVADGAYSSNATLPGGLTLPSASGSAVSNTFSGNTWTGMTINSWDASGWAGSTPPPQAIQNTWGPNASPAVPDNSTDPTVNGNATLGANFYGS